MEIVSNEEKIILKENITLGDKLVYKTIGITSAIVGHSLSTLEKIANKVQDNTKTSKSNKKVNAIAKTLAYECHNYSGPMSWLSEYILGKEKNKHITVGNKYYNDWLEDIDYHLNKETEKYIMKNLQIEFPHSYMINRRNISHVAQRLLQEGVSYGNGPMYAEGLTSMIGYATVKLKDTQLVSIDQFDFEKQASLIAPPIITNPFLKIASWISPTLAKNMRQDEKPYVISDRYFHIMSGNEFYTILEGPLTDLNKFGWNFK